MKVQIRDRKALSSLLLSSLRAYLKSHGWSDDGPWGGGRATMYLKEHGGCTRDILVPVQEAIGDYAESMAEAVAVLAEVEGRSQLDVFYDLSAAGSDVIRMRSVNGAAGKSLSLPQSSGLLHEAYRLLVAAARATEKPRAVYRGRPSADVAQYLDEVRLVPGYGEGYALTLHAPAHVENGAPIPSKNQKSPAGMGVEENFGGDLYAPSRRATYTLARALEYANTAIAETIAGDAFKLFEKGVRYGISARLCDSVANLALMGQGIEIDIVWADGRPSDAAHFRFSKKICGHLVGSGKIFPLQQMTRNSSRPHFRKHEERHDHLLRSRC